MPRHNDVNDNDYQMETQAVSSKRPPQFNEVNCGYRCGWGCCEPQGGDDDGGGVGDSGTDATPTLIGSDDGIGELDEAFPHERFGDPDPPSLRDHEIGVEEPGSTVVFNDTDESLRFHADVTTQGNHSNPSVAASIHDGSLDSSQNEPITRSHSSAGSDAGTIGRVSRNVPYAGIGAWDEANRFPGHFCQTPLRLSPQYEDCRGPPMSHLVTQDYSTLLGPVGYAWGVQRAPVGYAIHRDAE